VFSILRPNSSPFRVSAGLQSGDVPVVLLLKLVAVGGFEIIREIGEQVEVVVECVGHDLRGGTPVLEMPFGLEAVALGIAAVRGALRAVERDQARGDRAGRDLVRRIPIAVIGHRHDAGSERRVALAVLEDAVVACIVVRDDPGPVFVVGLERLEQVPLPQRFRTGKEEAGVAVAPPSIFRKSAGRVSA
jgi:hypothetical protein